MKSYIDELDRNIFNFVEYEGYDDRYPSLSMQAFSSDFYDEIRHASRRLFQIFCKAAKVFQMAPDDFARNMDCLLYTSHAILIHVPPYMSGFSSIIATALPMEPNLAANVLPALPKPRTIRS